MAETKKRSILVTIALTLWLGTIAAGITVLNHYSTSPNSAVAPPARWPVDSKIPREPGQPVLVMFAHPHCPCTRASLGELELLMTHSPGRLSSRVSFIRPTGTEDDWTKGDLWSKASAIPGVTVLSDDAGVEARRFHCQTSGHTVLYDKDGRLVFQGGITISRGHSGDNPGRSAIEAILERGIAPENETPVYGCSLIEDECSQDEKACEK